MSSKVARKDNLLMCSSEVQSQLHTSHSFLLQSVAASRIAFHERSEVKKVSDKVAGNSIKKNEKSFTKPFFLSANIRNEWRPSATIERN